MLERKLVAVKHEGVDMWFVIVPFAVLLLASIVDVVTGGMD
jgi:hypothetical protein